MRERCWNRCRFVRHGSEWNCVSDLDQITPGILLGTLRSPPPLLNCLCRQQIIFIVSTPPSEADVVKALAITSRDQGFPDDDGTWIDLDPNSSIHNVRIVVEPINDAIDAPRYFPNIGLAQMHAC